MIYNDMFVHTSIISNDNCCACGLMGVFRSQDQRSLWQVTIL